MSLLELKHYFQKNKQATFSQLRQAFPEDAFVLNDMLQILIHKKIICCKTLKPACGTECNQCEFANVQIFEQID